MRTHEKDPVTPRAEIQGLPDGVSVFLGDSRSMPEVEDESVNLFVTSPPYWNLKKYGAHDDREVGQSGYEEYLADMQRVWDECYKKAVPNAVLVINVNSRRHQKRFYPIAFDIVARMTGWKLLDHVIWYIPNALPQPNHYMERLLDNKYESCLVFTKDGATDYKFNKPRVPQKYKGIDPRAHNKNERGRCVGNVLRIPAYRPPNIKKLGYHVAAFPEELAAFFVQCFTEPKDVVMDPFTGSGTTMKVAAAMGRNCVGYELHGNFEELIRGRINENWEIPDWRNIDILHSATMDTSPKASRKSHFLKSEPKTGDLL